MIFDILPMPSSTSLFVTNQNIAHKTMVQMNVGNIIVPILLKFEDPPTWLAKNWAGLVPHPK